ncbi:hypothetical protein [Natronorubrum sp. DTA7]|uniref:hypothetical protein n=1 Tax=Natronorubrum sp. DTA7 TaxID=3447016 RepID=UPI003F849BF7
MAATNSGQVAFDIETVNADRPAGVDFDFKNPEHLEMFCICVAHRPEPGAEIDHEVIFREGTSPDAELDVFEAAVQWMECKPDETVLTFNGDGFDFIHLEGRAQIAAETLEGRFDVVDRVESFINSTESDDVRPEAVEFCNDEYTSMEDACEAVGVDAPETRLDDYDLPVDPIPERSSYRPSKPVLMGCDVPVIGERYLNLAERGATDLEPFEEMHAALKHYAETDVQPLFELADARPFSA